MLDGSRTAGIEWKFARVGGEGETTETEYIAFESSHK
jgi:hypothetical protein